VLAMRGLAARVLAPLRAAPPLSATTDHLLDTIGHVQMSKHSRRLLVLNRKRLTRARRGHLRADVVCKQVERRRTGKSTSPSEKSPEP